MTGTLGGKLASSATRNLVLVELTRRKLLGLLFWLDASRLVQPVNQSLQVRANASLGVTLLGSVVVESELATVTDKLAGHRLPYIC